MSAQDERLVGADSMSAQEEQLVGADFTSALERLAGEAHSTSAHRVRRLRACRTTPRISPPSTISARIAIS